MALPVVLTRSIELVFGAQLASDFVGPFVEANTRIDTLKKTLELVTGDSQEAADKFGVLKTAAYNLGLDIAPLGSNYAKLLEAVKGTNLEGADTDRLFLGIASAAARLGLDGGAAERALKAVEQIASKGKVSLEEVRGQLGDAIPGAVPIFAQAAGVTVAEFYKLVEQGKITSGVLKGVADILVEKYGDGTDKVNSLQASFGRLSTSITDVSTAIGEAGINTAIKTIVDEITEEIKGFADVVRDIDAAFVAAKEAIEKEEWGEAFDIISQAFDAVFEKIKDKLPPTFKNIIEEIKSGVNGVKGVVEGIDAKLNLPVTFSTEKTEFSDFINDTLGIETGDSGNPEIEVEVGFAGNQGEFADFVKDALGEVTDDESGKIVLPVDFNINEDPWGDLDGAIKAVQGSIDTTKTKAIDLATEVKNANAAFRTLGSKETVDDIDKISSALSEIATNPKTNGDQFLSVFNSNLDKLIKNPEGITGFIDAIKKAFEEKKIDTGQLEAAYAAVGAANDGTLGAVKKLQDGFVNLEKTANGTNKGLDDKSTALINNKNKAQEYNLKLTEIASNEKIKLIQAKVELDIANAEANAAIITSTFDAVASTVTSTGDVISSILGPNGPFASGVRSRLDPGFDVLEEQLENENKMRKEAFELQKELTQAQIDNIRAKTLAFNQGTALIKVEGAGLQPHLEAFMWEILKQIQTRVSQDGLDMILGTA